MINPEPYIKQATVKAIHELFGHEISETDVLTNQTHKEFEGDLTIVVFPFVRYAKKSPEQTAQTIGEWLCREVEWIDCFTVIKGFLNLSISNQYWLNAFANLGAAANYGQLPDRGEVVVLEYCGPNTNKPLHLGHIRNMLLGYSMASILSAAGYDVHKVNIYNDRGIAICKSMLAWQLTGNNGSPETANMKGDHYVGTFYVKYNDLFTAEVEELVKQGMKREDAEKNAPIYLKAQEMLRKWEAGDTEIRELWQRMNDWVYAGFEKTYAKLGIDFEKAYYESETYQMGKRMVMEGLKKDIFYQNYDESIWVDLTDKGLDNKLLIRNDGTSVYITQDLAVAEQRYADYKMDRSIYVVADEQAYHFKVLQHTLEKLGMPYAAGIYHLAYGMVDLPSGKMKSREGTTVDADDLIADMIKIAEAHTGEMGKTEGMSEEEKRQLHKMVGLGALKYFILRVGAVKRMLFNPNESIELLGNTGPFIQYSHARMKSVARKYGQTPAVQFDDMPLHVAERELIIQLTRFGNAIAEAADKYDPSIIAAYAYQTAKVYNRLWHEVSILGNDDPKLNDFRVALSVATAKVIAKAMTLLGIDVPEVM